MPTFREKRRQDKHSRIIKGYVLNEAFHLAIKKVMVGLTDPKAETVIALDDPENLECRRMVAIEHKIPTHDPRYQVNTIIAVEIMEL